MLNSAFLQLALTFVLILLISVQARAENAAFQSSLRLLQPNTITEIQALEFPLTAIGQNVNVTVAPSDGLAAVFIATGTPDAPIVGSVVEGQIWIDNGISGKSSNKIRVGNFTVGGNLDANGNTVLNASGIANDLRVGATAEIRSNDPPGTYSGTATFRVLYI